MSLRQRPVTLKEIDACVKKLEELLNSESKPFVEETGVEYRDIGCIWPVVEKAMKASDEECHRIVEELMTGTYKFKDDGSDVIWKRCRALWI